MEKQTWLFVPALSDTYQMQRPASAQDPIMLPGASARFMAKRRFLCGSVRFGGAGATWGSGAVSGAGRGPVR